jgi:hypothetical protein
MSNRASAAIGFVLFLAVLAIVDWSLRRWGSLAVNRRPRPGGRVTALFLSVCTSCALVELLAARLWTWAPTVAVVVALLQVPVAVVVALALDRTLPSAGDAEG